MIRYSSVKRKYPRFAPDGQGAFNWTSQGSGDVGGIVFIQSVEWRADTVNPPAGNTIDTSNVPISTTSGHLLRAICAWKDTQTFVGFSDNAGNTWIPTPFGEVFGSAGVPPGVRVRSFYAKNCIGNAAHFFSLELNAPGFGVISVSEVSGLSPTSPFDQSGSVAESANSLTHTVSTGGATSSPDEIVFGTGSLMNAQHNLNNGFSIGSPWISITDLTFISGIEGTGILDVYQIVAATGVQTFDPTTIDDGSAVLIIETYRADVSIDVAATVGQVTMAGLPATVLTATNVDTGTPALLALTGLFATVTNNPPPPPPGGGGGLSIPVGLAPSTGISNPTGISPDPGLSKP